MTDNEETEETFRVQSDESVQTEIRGDAEWLITNRKRGILTESDRLYLTGENELTGQKERDARYRIRQRVKNSLLDFPIVQWEMNPDDRLRVYESFKKDVSLEDGLGEEIDSDDRLAIISSILELVLELQRITSKDRGNDPIEQIEYKLEDMIKSTYGLLGTNVSIEPEYYDIEESPEEIAEKIVNGEGSTKDIAYVIQRRDRSVILDKIDDNQESVEIDQGDGVIAEVDVEELSDTLKEFQGQVPPEFSPDMIKMSRYREDQ